VLSIPLSQSSKADKAPGKPVVAAGFFRRDRFLLSACTNKVRLGKYKIFAKNSREFKTKAETDPLYKSTYTFTFSNAKAVTAMGAANSYPSSLAVCALSNRGISVLDLNAGRIVWKINDEHPDAHAKPVHAIVVKESLESVQLPVSAHQLFLSIARDSSVKLWDLRERKACLVLRGHKCVATEHGGARFSPCMRYIGVGSEDGRGARLYSLRTATELCSIGGNTGGGGGSSVVADLDFHPSHPQIVLADGEGGIQFFSCI